MQVVGIDIGYGALKVAAGPRYQAPQVVVRPAGAAPRARLARAVAEGRLPPYNEREVAVEVGGEPWVAAVEPDRIEPGWTRPLHDDYTRSPVYCALAQAALALQLEATGAHDIDILVTGLPVSQAQDQQRIDGLRRLFAGRHQLAAGSVAVGEVKVIAQPIGAFVDLVSTTRDADLMLRLTEGTVLVLDAGFYSYDWALIVRGELRQSASGTSLEAMSVVLERAAARAAEGYGGRHQPQAIDRALRTGRRLILQGGRTVEITPHVNAAADEAVPAALEAVRQALRRESVDVDLVYLAGGGGALYARGVEVLYPGARVVHAIDPVSANARGYHAFV